MTRSTARGANCSEKRRARTRVLLACAASFVGSGVAAQPGGTPRAAGAAALPSSSLTSDASECNRLRAGALAQVTCALARGLSDAPQGALVVSAPIASDGRIEKPGALAARIAQLLAGALGRGAGHASEPSTLASARTLAAGAAALVFVRAEIVRGEFRVTADAYDVRERFWQRVRHPSPAPRAHAFASSRIDAELRAFFPPVPLVARQIDKARAAEDFFALACEDADQDGALELIWAGRRHVGFGRIRQGQLSPLLERPWAELAPVAPHPLREPLAGIAVQPGRFIDIGLSDRANAIRFDPLLTPVAKLGRHIPWPAGGCAALRDIGLGGTIEACVKNEELPARVSFSEPLDALAAARIVERDGRVRDYYAGRSSSTSELIVRDETQRSVRIPASGAQVALADLDLDGQPEIVTGADTLDPQADYVLARTWQSNGQLVERWRVPLESGVNALAVCPVEGDRARTVVVATRAALWMIR
ncbi:MAG TPA: hypothetical protein VK524_12555 [Polyangiaceae bacterium]|nr:hypothetical protein [Polyangiaceae bacterium]